MADGCLGPYFCKPPKPSPIPLFLLQIPKLPLHFPSKPMAAHCHCISNPRPYQPSLLVFSGGTAFNGVVEELKKLTVRVAHVLPVSDDGGSTAEIVRVLGGPAVGDIRSRCLRLADQSTSEALAVRRLLGHRLPINPQQAKSEWYEVVEGEHSLWEGVSKPYRETIRSFLAYFQNEDGTIVRGQNEISHPAYGSIGPVDKGRSSVPALPSRIKRVFYMSSEGTNSLHEVFPTVNPAVLDQLSNVDCIVYAMGSLFTSLCPSLVLLGIGEVISSRSCPKVLLLNGTHDRETSGFSASSFVIAITDALNRTYGDSHNCLKHFPSQYINTLLVPKDGEIPIDDQILRSQGIFDVVIVDSIRDPKVGIIFDPVSLINALGNVVSRYMRTKD
ncbi:gluconeogenesis factor isoform X2 [Durio zibethinus]|uniref:Gluconeogenesis factor isoform X2 n=1 Tax=Durio zibethinus TaxID=66656 RepID=A0A6P5WWD7_DURZI|nr:gluconeogenesis factor isoform X2 [Durio zibethinus]